MYQINRTKRVVIHGQIIQSVFSFMMEKTAAAALNIALVFKKKREPAAKRKKRTKWVKQWLLQRPILGVYDALLAELWLAEDSDYRNYLRMRPTDFEAILNLIAEYIMKKDTISQINASVCSIFLLLLEDILLLGTNK